MPYISTSSRRHGMSLPLARMKTPVRLSIGPVGRWSPGIHCGYSSVSAPAETGMVSCACRMWRGASVRSTCSTMGVVGCAAASSCAAGLCFAAKAGRVREGTSNSTAERDGAFIMMKIIMPTAWQGLSPAGDLCRRVFMESVTLQRGTVPACLVGGCAIGAVQKCAQCFFRGWLLAHVVVLQQKLTHLGVEECCGRFDLRLRKSSGRWRCIAVEGRFAGASIAGPEAGADDFMRVRFARDGIGAGTLRRALAVRSASLPDRSCPRRNVRG